MSLSKRDKQKVILSHELIFTNPIFLEKINLLRSKWKIDITLHPDDLFKLSEKLESTYKFQKAVEVLVNEMGLNILITSSSPFLEIAYSLTVPRVR